MRKIFVSNFVLCLGLLGVIYPTSAGAPPIDNPLVIGTGNLVDVSWSANGDYFAVSTTGGVILYDNMLGESQYLTEVGALGGRLSQQPDGTLLAMTGGYDTELRRYEQTAYVWQLSDNAFIEPIEPIVRLEFNEGTGNIHALWSPDGTTLAFPVIDVDAHYFLALYIRILDPLSGDYHDVDISALMLDDVTGWAWSEDGTEFIGIRHREFEQVIIDLESGEELRHEPLVSTNGLSLSPDGTSTASLTDDGIVITTSDNEFILQPQRANPRIDGFFLFNWSYNGDYAYASGLRTEPNAVIVNVHTGEIILELFYDQVGNVKNVLFQPDGASVIVTTLLGDIYLYNLATGDLIAQRWLSGGGTGISLSPDGTQVASATARSQNVYIRDAHTGDAVQMLESPNGTDVYNPVYEVAWSPDGRYIATGGRREGIVEGEFESLPIDVFIRDAETGEVVQTVPALAYNGDFILELEWSADSRTVAWTTQSNETAQSHVGAWDVDNETLLYQQVFESNVFDIGLHPDNTTLALVTLHTPNFTYNLDLVDLNSGEIADSIPLETEYGASIDWHPDGDYLALLERSGDNDTADSVTVFEVDGNAQFSMDITDAIMLSRVPDIVWNPAGTQLAFSYVVEGDNSGTTYGVMILDVSLETQEITIHKRVERESSLGYSFGFPPIAWSGDGTRLAVSVLTEESLIIQVSP
ncbi:MAG: WD40 repeat domain-containing protein [Aggregatilineales bacterium]